MAAQSNHSGIPWDTQTGEGYATNDPADDSMVRNPMEEEDYNSSVISPGQYPGSAASDMKLETLLTLYVPPIIISVGIIGNILCAIVLLRSALAKFSSSHYLAAISLANTLYILLFSLQWITLLGYNGYHRPIICQFSDLLGNIASFLSMWLPVCFCVDRYIAISWPAESPKLCTVLRTRVVVTVLVIFSLVVYLNTSTTTGVQHDKYGVPWCAPLPLPFRQNKFVRMLDWVVIKLLPYFVILALMVAMCVSVSNESRGLSSVPDEPSQIRCATFVYFGVFIMVHLPAEILTSVLSFRMANNPTWIPTRRDRCAKQILQYLSDSGMALNVFILVVSYPLFRQYLVAYFHTCKQSRCGRVSFLCTCHKPCSKSNIAAENKKIPEHIGLEPKETTKFDTERGEIIKI